MACVRYDDGDWTPILLVCDRFNRRVQVIRQEDGTWVRNLTPAGIFLSPVGVVVTRNKQVVVCDSRLSAIITVTLREGTVVSQFGTRGDKPGQLSSPSGIALTPDEDIAVADWGNHRICIFKHATGELLHTWGGVQGAGLGQFTFPTSIAVLRTGVIVVAEALNRDHQRIQMVDPDTGQGIRQWGQYGQGIHHLHGVSGLCESLAVANQLFVADMMNHRITVFDCDTGAFVRSFGSQGSELGQLRKPAGVTISPNTGQLFISEDGNNRITVFY